MEIFTILSKLQTWAPVSDAFNVLGYTFFLSFTARFLEASRSTEVTSPSLHASGTPTVSLTPTPTSCAVPLLSTPWLCIMLVLTGVALTTVSLLVYPTRRSTPLTSFSSFPISTSAPSFTARSKARVTARPSSARLKILSSHGQASAHICRILAFIFSRQTVRAICYGLIVSQCTPAMHAVFPLSLSATSATHLPILTGILTVLATLYPALRIFVANFNPDKTAFNHSLRSDDKSTAQNFPSSASKTEKYDQDQDLDANAGAELDDMDPNIFFMVTPPSPTNTDTSSNYVRRWLEDVHHAGLEHFPESDGDTPRDTDNDTASEVLDWYRIFDEHQTEKAADADSYMNESENQDEEWVVFHTLMDEEVLGMDEQHMDELQEEREEYEAFLMLTNLAGKDELSTSDVGLDDHQAKFPDHPSPGQAHDECALSAVGIDDELSSGADTEPQTSEASIFQDDVGSVDSAAAVSLPAVGIDDELSSDAEPQTNEALIFQDDVGSVDSAAAVSLPAVGIDDELSSNAEPQTNEALIFQDDVGSVDSAAAVSLSAIGIDDELSSDADAEHQANEASIFHDDVGSVDSAAVVSTGVVDDICMDTSDIGDNQTSSIDVDVQPSTLLWSSCMESEVQCLPTPDTDIQSTSSIEHDTLFSPTGEADLHHSSTIGGEPIVLSSPDTQLDIPVYPSDIQVDTSPSNGKFIVLSSSSELNIPAFSSDIQVDVSPSDNECHSLPSNTLEDGSDRPTYKENTHIEGHSFEIGNVNSSPLTLADLEIWGPEYELTLPEDGSYTLPMISASPSPTPFASRLLDSTSQSWEALFDANEAMLLDSGILPEGQLDLASELQGAEFNSSNICFINDEVSFLVSEDSFVPPTKEDAPIIYTTLPLSQSSTSTSEAAPPPSELTSSTSTSASSIPVASKPPAPRPKIRSSILGLMDAPRAGRGSGSWR